jgi:hypothetical protein
MNWINISEINKQENIEGKNILVWQNNLSDAECSRFQRAVFYKGDEKVSSFIIIYPIGTDRNHYREDKEWKNYDLEGDMCKITHFAMVESPSF